MKRRRWIREAPVVEPDPLTWGERVKRDVAGLVRYVIRESKRHVLWLMIVVSGLTVLDRLPATHGLPDLPKAILTPVAGGIALLVFVVGLALAYALVILPYCFYVMATSKSSVEMTERIDLVTQFRRLRQPPPQA